MKEYIDYEGKGNIIRNLCYELYIEDWKKSHNITREDEMMEMLNYFSEIEPSEYKQCNFTYHDYLNGCGYRNGELYVCYDEFIDNEYQEDEYIRELLKYNKKFYNMYKEDLIDLQAKGSN